MIEEDRAALREALASALDREAGTQDALDDALRRVAELESHLEQSEQYRQAAQDERDRLARRVAELKAALREMREDADDTYEGLDQHSGQGKMAALAALAERLTERIRALAGDVGGANG